MELHQEPLAGLYLFRSKPFCDERGYFLRQFCKTSLEEHGATGSIRQANIAYNSKKGTLRGLHFQKPPHAETKLVRCLGGVIYDVAVDLRPDSPTLYQYFGCHLSAENHLALLVPEGFAHGYLTLTDTVLVQYMVSADYKPEAERGLRFDDPAIGITWPADPVLMSEKDMRWPLLAGQPTRNVRKESIY